MPFDYTYQAQPKPVGFNGFDWGFNGGGSNNFSQYGANTQVQPGGIGTPGFDFNQNYGSSAISPVAGGWNWGTAANALNVGSGALSFIEGFKDLIGKGDADKQRKFAKNWSMRQWNTNARLHDNQLQSHRNSVLAYNAQHGGQDLNTNDNLKTLGVWGSGKNRTLAG